MKNGSATIADELTDADKSVTSLYTLKQSAGPALHSIVIMHLLSEPVGGLGGDFEFTIMSAAPDKVVMSGTKTRNMITLTPMPKKSGHGLVIWKVFLQIRTLFFWERSN